MIQGYVTPSSVFPGDPITIHFGAVKGKDENSRTEPGQATKFRTYFFRRGENWQLQRKSDVWTAGPAKIRKVPAGDTDASPGSSHPPQPDDATNNWDWPST